MAQTSTSGSVSDQAKKDRILVAAKERLSRFGYKKTTVDEIAEQAGISKRTLYEMFASKEALLADLVMAEALAFRKSILSQMKALADPREKLELLCELTRQYFDENPFLGQVLADHARLYAPFLGNEILWVEDGTRELINRILKEGVQTGVFRAMDVPATTACVFKVMRGFTYRRAAVDDGNAEWINFIMHALAPKG
jgi:AcrR family transcriptional regulator